MSIERFNQAPRMSQAVVYNGVAYLSGVTAGDAGDDVEAQAKAVLAKIDERLALAGTDKSKLLSAMIWLSDIGNDFAPMNAIWEAWVDPENKPARATVEAQLARPTLKIEIQVVAAVA